MKSNNYSISLLAKVKHITTLSFVLWAVVVVLAGGFICVIPYALGAHPDLKQICLSACWSLVSIGLISIIYELFLRRAFMTEVGMSIANSVESAFTKQIERNDLLVSLANSGIESVNDRLDVHAIGPRFANAAHIRIMQTWEPNLTAWEDYLEKALQRDETCIQIIFCDPNQSQIGERSEDINKSREVGAALVRQNLTDLKKMIGKMEHKRGKIEVKLSADFLPFALYAADTTAFFGLYWRGTKAVNGPCLQVQKMPRTLTSPSSEIDPPGFRKMLAVYILQTFDKLWEESSPYPLLDATPAAAGHHTPTAVQP